MSSHVILCPSLKRDHECLFVRSMHLSLPFSFPLKRRVWVQMRRNEVNWRCTWKLNLEIIQYGWIKAIPSTTFQSYWSGEYRSIRCRLHRVHLVMDVNRTHHFNPNMHPTINSRAASIVRKLKKNLKRKEKKKKKNNRHKHTIVPNTHPKL